MTIFVSRAAIAASWGSVAAEDISVLYRDVIVRALRTDSGTRMCALRAEAKQLRWIACDLDALSSAWLHDGNKDNRAEALCMQRAVRKIEKQLKAHR